MPQLSAVTADAALPDDLSDLVSLVDGVLRSEANAILGFAEQSGSLVDAIEMIASSTGPLIVAGIGKSGHIGCKIASTFRSLGKPSIFLHPAEASHGDLGLIHDDSVVLILSNSGETAELSDLLFYCRRHRNPIIALTGRANSTLVHAAGVAIVYGTVREACRNGLAPTTSTTLALAIGDAIAIGVSHLAKTEAEDFRRYHPGGKLGAGLRTVGEIMRTGDALPTVSPETPMSEVVVNMSEKSLGVAILEEGGRATGIITDGDMRRNIPNLWNSRAKHIATPDPVRITEEWLVTDALEIMSVRGITVALVECENGFLRGALHIHDGVQSQTA